MAYRSITATPEFREMERLRSKARHGEAQALWNAGRQKAVGIAKNLLRRNGPIDEIMEDTGLTRGGVENLRKAD